MCGAVARLAHHADAINYKMLADPLALEAIAKNGVSEGLERPIAKFDIGHDPKVRRGPFGPVLWAEIRDTQGRVAGERSRQPMARVDCRVYDEAGDELRAGRVHLLALHQHAAQGPVVLPGTTAVFEIPPITYRRSPVMWVYITFASRKDFQVERNDIHS